MDDWRSSVAQPALSIILVFQDGRLFWRPKRQLFLDADCFCFPSYYQAESFGIVLVEAMAFGLPIITARWRTIPELLPNGYAGLVDPRSPSEIEEDLRKQLKFHWSDRADVVVVSPEIEEWLWRGIPHVAKMLEMSAETVRKRLRELGFLGEREPKPSRPKEAFLALLHERRKVPSSAVYAGLARQMSLRTAGCRSSSFPRLVERLREWFPKVTAQPPGARAPNSSAD